MGLKKRLSRTNEEEGNEEGWRPLSISEKKSVMTVEMMCEKKNDITNSDEGEEKEEVCERKKHILQPSPSDRRRKEAAQPMTRKL